MNYFKSIVLICLSLIFLFSVGKALHDRFHLVGASVGAFVSRNSGTVRDAKVDELLVENHLLREAMSEVKENQRYDQRLAELIEHYNGEKEKAKKSDLGARIDRQMRFVSSKVIFREPSFWGCYCWIDKGSENGEGVVKIDSPVVVGDDIIGIVDYVAKNRARVQLLTDQHLPVAVQAIRGDVQKAHLLTQTEALVEMIEDQELIGALTHFKEKLKKRVGNRKFGKGQVFGSSYSLFRKRQSILKGIGFDANESIQLGDLLVTTGMDGVFPKGFHVARVTRINALKEGDIAYEIEARSTYPNFDDLSIVQVLPSLRQNRYFDAHTL